MFSRHKKQRLIPWISLQLWHSVNQTGALQEWKGKPHAGGEPETQASSSEHSQWRTRALWPWGSNRKRTPSLALGSITRPTTVFTRGTTGRTGRGHWEPSNALAHCVDLPGCSAGQRNPNGPQSLPETGWGFQGPEAVATCRTEGPGESHAGEPRRRERLLLVLKESAISK